MRKFALLPLMFCLASAQIIWAQPRDLFAEFEQDVSAQELKSSAAEIPASSASEVPASSSESDSAKDSISSKNLNQYLLSSADVQVSSSSFSSSSLIPPIESNLTAVDSVKSDTLMQSLDSVKISEPFADSIKQDSVIVSIDSIKDTIAKPESSSSINLPSSSSVSSSSIQVVESQVMSSSSMSRRDLLGPVKVSKVYGLDDMKGRYKSPRKAMFMSLVIPGSGQLYTGGSSFTYVRGAAYLALEAALWGSWYYFSVHKYDKQVRKYKNYAKSHFSIGRFESQMRDIYLNQLSDDTEESRFEIRYMGSRENFCKALYGTASASGCYTAGKLFSNDKAHIDRFSISNPATLGSEIKSQKGFYDEDLIYQLIAEKNFVLGWDDVDSIALGQNLLLEDVASEIIPLGTSKNLSKYRDLRSEANDLADMQAWFFGGIILNHLVSAIDAALTAHSHNKSLYSEELSWYNRTHLDSYMSFVNGFDIGVQASWGF